MLIPLPTLEGRLLRRYKRFFADVELPGGEVVTAHCPNTGSLLGCTPRGARAILRDSANQGRKLRYTFQTVEVDGTWVNVDTGLPGDLVAEALAAGGIPELAGYAEVRREVTVPSGSRLDFVLEAAGKTRCFVEVKSTTLAQDGVALFPDAVTARGKKHLFDLLELFEAGHRAVILFIVARADVTEFAPADVIDPEYARALRDVAARGVEPLAYSTRVEPDRIDIARRLHLLL